MSEIRSSVAEEGYQVKKSRRKGNYKGGGVRAQQKDNFERNGGKFPQGERRDRKYQNDHNNRRVNVNPKPQEVVEYKLHNRRVKIEYKFLEPNYASSPSRDPAIFRSENVMYIRTGELSKEEVEEAMYVATDMANAVHLQLTEKYEDGNFMVNMPSNAQGKTYGFCYVWLASKALSNLLSCRNLDGSDRVELTPDPTWVAPEKVIQFGTSSQDSSDRWADCDDEEEEPQPPMISKKLPGMVGRIYVLYSQKQQGENAPTSRDKGIALDFDLSFSGMPDEGLQHNVLSAILVPPSVTNEIIREAFAPFAGDRDGKYPLVTSKNDEGGRRVFVTFDYSGKDAIFALQMMKCCRLAPRGWIQGSEKVLLLFKHARAR